MPFTTVDLKFKQASVHNDLRSNGSPSLPLPKNTVFAYRYSENSASYFTIGSKEEVIIFFKSIANKKNFSEKTNTDNGKTKLDLRYNNKLYSVTIYKSIDPKGYYLQADSK